MFSLRQLGTSSIQFMRRNLSILLFLIIIFISGVTFGAIAVKMLSYAEKNQLVNYLANFFQNFKGKLVLQQEILAQEAVFYNLKLILLVWILGISIVGMPIIPILVFLRGFILGFAVGFLVDELAVKGFLFAVVSIVPHNLFAIPSLIIAGTAGIAFALNLFKSRFKRMPINFAQYFFGYSTLMIILAVILVTAGLIESFLTPILMSFITKTVIY
ncbi:stage II sporulation protein M [Acetohalobium arabaticum]|uniref:Stage II sporulation protein M n=1 Tax=Acetohalobium arabaticum (strain ATCC 49924 / DSM 5501 / Z-7288) TaxID=574087 RepID=D9QRS6_ACEAZ|nr:stage II sporulation protein M [Acetohalobium arabaticum]ADL13217.1 stage II sporulation protein M [Acetohalobium arabaticum DSM 5501]